MPITCSTSCSVLSSVVWVTARSRGAGGAVEQVEGAVAAGECLGLLLDALLELGVIAGEILDHEVEGLAQLPELVGIPRRDAHAEVAAADAVRRIEEIRQGLDDAP
jgi:hypothetical protein